MGRIVHLRTDRVDLHLLGRVGVEEWEQVGRVLDRRIKSCGLRLPSEDHRHPVMDRLQRLACLRGDDRATADFLTVRRGSGVPQPREPDRFPGLEHNVEGLFYAALFLPLIEPIGHYETATLPECGTEGRHRTDGFCAGVNHPVPNRGVLRPGRDEAPSYLRQIPVSIVPDHNHRPHGRDIVARDPHCRLCRGRPYPEALGDGGQIRCKGEAEASAHESSPGVPLGVVLVYLEVLPVTLDEVPVSVEGQHVLGVLPLGYLIMETAYLKWIIRKCFCLYPGSGPTAP